MKTQESLILLLRLAGIGQIFIALVYEWVRRILGWDEDVGKMANRWNRQIAHTYSRYIQGINLSFGLISLLYAPAFFEGNAITNALALLIALYWAGRLFVALNYYDTKVVVERWWLYRVGGLGFNGLFAYLAIVYMATFAMTLK